MRKKRRARSDYGSIQTAIWLIGIGVLALTDWWWPGIMFLIGISVLASAVLPSSKSDQDAYPTVTLAAEDSSNQGVEERKTSAVMADRISRSQTVIENDKSWLPSRCPACGAPITSETVIWKDHRYQIANCSYCDTHLKPIP